MKGTLCIELVANSFNFRISTLAMHFASFRLLKIAPLTDHDSNRQAHLSHSIGIHEA
jgi:hypothetical protein